MKEIYKLFKSQYINVIYLIYFFIISKIIFEKEEQLISIVLITLLTFSISLIINNFSIILFRLFILITLLILVPYYITINMFDKVSYSNIYALHFTNYAESSSYLKTISGILIIKTILIFCPFIYFFIKGLRKINHKLNLLLLFVIILFSGYKYISNWNYMKGLDSEKTINSLKNITYTAPFRILTNIYKLNYLVKRDIKYQKELRNLKETWEVDKNIKKTEKITVFIIGESVRKDFLQIYNPKLQNTPFLNSVNKIQFNNALSFASHTVQSLTNAFISEKDNELYFPNNIVTLGNKVGFKTSWLSNQGSTGQYDNEFAAMGKQANSNNIMSKGNYDFARSDLELIDIFKKEVKNHNLIFLHTIGSHPDPCVITNNEYSYFYKSKSLSCYIESIKRTDKFIEDIYNQLKSFHRPFQLIYFSDHGLFITPEQKVIHHDDYKQNYEIPLFIIDSELKENKIINQQRNLKDFLIFYQELLNIKSKNIHADYKFISEEKATNSDILYGNLKFSQLKNNPK